MLRADRAPPWLADAANAAAAADRNQFAPTKINYLGEGRKTGCRKSRAEQVGPVQLFTRTATRRRNGPSSRLQVRPVRMKRRWESQRLPYATFARNVSLARRMYAQRRTGDGPRCVRRRDEPARRAVQGPEKHRQGLHRHAHTGL